MKNKKELNISTIFLKYSKGIKKYFFIGILFAFINQICTLFIPLISRFIIDKVIVMGFFNYFKITSIIGIGVLLLMVSSQIIANFFLAKFNLQIGKKFKFSFFKKMQFASFEFYKNTDKGAISYRILNDTEKITGYLIQLMAAIPMFFLLIISGTILLNLNRVLSMIIFVLLITQSLTVVFFKKPIENSLYLVKETSQNLNSFLVNHFSKIELIRSFANEKHEQELFDKCQTEQINTSLKNFILHKVYSAVSVFFNNIWTFAILWYGGIQIMEDQMTFGTLTTFLLMSNLMSAPLTVIINQIISYQDVKASLKRINEYYNEKKYIEFNQSSEKDYDFDKKISFKNVDFAYQDDKLILDKVSFSILPKKINVILGPNGVGKSTIVKLLIKFYNLKSGDIHIGEKSYKNIDIHLLRKNIQLVLQDFYVFKGTILENITYGVEGVSKKDVLRVVKQLKMNFINMLPNRLDTYIGENGLNLSTGEAQRIAIARALLKDPKVLILDESTAFLDKETESILKELLQKLKKKITVIIISHRSSTIDFADNKILIEKD